MGSAIGVTVEENLIMNRRDEFTRFGFLSQKALKEFSAALVNRYNIEGKGADFASSLSGGNLQKLILAREIDRFRDYMVFSEPTWGLDIASSAFVRNEIASLCKKGAAVILISTNLDEILELAGRIIVMYRGKISGVFSNREGGDCSSIKEAIGVCMQGISRNGAEKA